MWQHWRGKVCASLPLTAYFVIACFCGAVLAQEPRFFRIGTAATGGSFFEVGGLVAGAISGPADGPPCGRGGSCGVRGLVAVAQATRGSIENLRLINAGQIESGFAQADLAAWAYKGLNLFSEAGPQRNLRAIGSLFPAAAHLVVRADSPISTLSDLAGKTVSIGEAGSGSAADAAVIFAVAGFGAGDLTQKHLRPGPAAEELKSGTIDALFLVGGYPMPVIRDLAGTIPIRLIPIEGDIVGKLKGDFPFYQITEIPAGTYAKLDTATPSLGFAVLWLVNADVGAGLVYEVTQALWNPATAKSFAALDPIGKSIRLERALEGLTVPLHPGAERFYREAGLPVDDAPRAAAAEPVKDGPVKKKDLE